MQTNSNAITIIFNLMHTNLIINIADLILLELSFLDNLHCVPIELSLLQLSLENLKYTAIVGVVMNPTALIHIPGDDVQIENLIREDVVAHIVGWV